MSAFGYHVQTVAEIEALKTEIKRLKAELDALREQEPAILPDEAYELGLDAIPYYAAPTPPSVPEGWQLVPKEPTDKMIRAATAEYVQACSRRTHPNIAWKKAFISMLAAAPKPGEEND